MKWHLVLTEKGDKRADEALEKEQYEDPIADLLWYLQDEGFERETSETVLTPEVVGAYMAYREEYEGYCGSLPPTQLEHFAKAINEGFVMWFSHDAPEAKLNSIRRIVERIAGPGNEADYPEVESALEEIAHILGL